MEDPKSSMTLPPPEPSTYITHHHYLALTAPVYKGPAQSSSSTTTTPADLDLDWTGTPTVHGDDLRFIILFSLGSSRDQDSGIQVDQESSEVPSGQSAQQHQTHLDSIFMLLEENIVTFVKNELKKMQKVLSPDYPECLESQREDEEVLDGEDEEQRSSREEFLKITLNFLRRMKQEELADCLQSRHVAAVCRKLKSNLKEKFQCLL
ncbi:protein NLRC3-like protein, partial [Lates japonicus]